VTKEDEVIVEFYSEKQISPKTRKACQERRKFIAKDARLATQVANFRKQDKRK